MKSRKFLKPFAASVATLVAGTQAHAATPNADATAFVSQPAPEAPAAGGLVLTKSDGPIQLAQHSSHSSHASHSSHSSHSSSAY